MAEIRHLHPRDVFDEISRLAIVPDNRPQGRTSAPAKRAQRTKPNQYIQVDCEWHRQAVQVCQSARGLAVAELLYRAAVLACTLTPTMPTKALKDYGISNKVRNRALRALAAAGLIELKHQVSRNPRITIVSSWLTEHVEGRPHGDE